VIRIGWNCAVHGYGIGRVGSSALDRLSQTCAGRERQHCPNPARTRSEVPGRCRALGLRRVASEGARWDGATNSVRADIVDVARTNQAQSGGGTAAAVNRAAAQKV
jgi:hypothetical protein